MILAQKLFSLCTAIDLIELLYLFDFFVELDGHLVDLSTRHVRMNLFVLLDWLVDTQFKVCLGKIS